MLLSLLQFSAFPSPLVHLMYKCYLQLLIRFISALQSRLVSEEKGAKEKENISKDQNNYFKVYLLIYILLCSPLFSIFFSCFHSLFKEIMK